MTMNDQTDFFPVVFQGRSMEVQVSTAVDGHKRVRLTASIFGMSPSIRVSTDHLTRFVMLLSRIIERANHAGA